MESEAEKDVKEIAQISFYLAKEKVTFEGIIDPEAALTARQGFGIHDFEVDLPLIFSSTRS